MFMLQAWCWLLFSHTVWLRKKNHIILKYTIQIFPLKDHSCVFDICACRLHPTLCDTRRQFYLTGTSSTEFTYICVCLWFCFLYLWVCKFNYIKDLHSMDELKKEFDIYCTYLNDEIFNNFFCFVFTGAKLEPKFSVTTHARIFFLSLCHPFFWY